MRLLGVLILVVMTTLAGSDPLLCPDGCTDELSQHADTAAPPHADCLACRHAMSTALPTFDLMPDGFAEQGGRDLPQHIQESSPFSIDHPPRLA